MLQVIRDRAQGIIIWIIVGLVILALSSFILNSYLGSSAKTYIAKVNDREISDREYRLAFNRYQMNLRRQLGDNFAKFFNQKMARQAVQTSLVNNALMQQLTHDAGFRTSNTAILQNLESTAAFKQEGKFSKDLYETLLKQNGYSRSQYESQIAQDQAQRQFINGLSDSAFVLDSEAQDYLRLERQQRDMAYLQVSMAEMRKGVKVTDGEIQSYYDAHKSDFMTDEQVQVSYIDLNTRELAKSIEVGDKELHAYYDSHKASYSRDDYSPAEKKIKQIAARIKKGESFAKLAKEYSQDTGTAGKGGELGYISRGMMVKPFEDAAFKLKKVGEVSQPVRTKYGYHLIKLEAVRKQDREQRKVSHILIKPEKVTESFEQARAQVKQAVQLERAEKLYYQDADKLDRLSYEYQDSLDPASEKLKIKIQQSPYFSRKGGPGLWRNPDVIKAAFSDDVLKGGLNSEMLKIGDDHSLVLRLKNHKAAQLMPLTEVKAQIQARLQDQKANAAADELAKKLAKQLEAGKKADSLAADNKAVSWNDTGFIGREAKYDANPDSNAKISSEVRRDVFQMDKPGDKPVIKPQQLSNGDAVVIVLRAVRDNPNKDSVDKLLTQMRQQLSSAESQSQYKLLLDYERAHSKVEINQQQESDQDL